MATYYIRTPANGGSDSNAGTSTSTAWATFTKAFSASGFTSGDTVYVEPGTYREVVTALNTSPTTRAYVIGDTDGAIFGTPGEVRLSSFTTSDDVAGSSSTCLNLNGRDNITLRRLRINSTGRTIDAGSGCTFIDVEDCILVSETGGAIAFTSSGSTALNCNLRRCIIHGIQDTVLITPNLSGSNIVLNMNIENCVVTARSNRAIYFSSSGTAATASGCTVTNCTLTGPIGIATAASRYSTSGGVVVRNTLIFLATTALNAGTSGQINENYNRLVQVATPRTNVTAGANTNAVGSCPIDFGASWLYSDTPRVPWYMPYVPGVIDSDGDTTVAPATDIHGVTRPDPPSIGAAEIATLYTTGGGLITHPGMTGGIRG